MDNYIEILGASDLYSPGDLLMIGKEPMVIYMVLGDKVYIRHLNTFEWIGFKFRRLLKKIGL